MDDCYCDALIATRMGVSVTVFAVAQHTGDTLEPLWFERYYAILHRARRRSGVPIGELSLQGAESAPSIDDDLQWWVRGPLKDRLQTVPDAARVDAATRRVGFVAAYTVEKGALSSTTNTLAIPRLLMRDVPPENSVWPVELGSPPGLADAETLR